MLDSKAQYFVFIGLVIRNLKIGVGLGSVLKRRLMISLGEVWIINHFIYRPTISELSTQFDSKPIMAIELPKLISNHN